MTYYMTTKMGIQKKVVIAILSAGFIALTIGLFVTYFQVKDILIEAIGRDFSEIAKKTAERFDASVKEEIDTFHRLSEEPAFIVAVKEQRRRSIEDYLKHYLRRVEEREEHLSLFVVNERGRIIGNSLLRSGDRVDQSEETWWKVTYNNGNGRLFASDIYLDRYKGNRVLDIGIPVFDASTGRVIGAIRSVMNVDVFFRFIKDMSFGQTGHGMLVDSEGTPVICSLLPLVEHYMNRPLITLITGKGGGWAVAEDDAHGGKNSIIGFSSVKYINSLGPESLGGHKWYTFVRQSPEETFTPVNKLMLKVFLLEFIIVLLITVLGLFIVRRLLLRPMRVLHDGVERIGRGELDYKIDINTGDELEVLARGFNKMGDALKEFYHGLEEKVKERTAALRASETKYRALMEQAYDAVFLINPDNGQIMEANLQAEILTGLSRETIIKTRYWELFPQEMTDRASEQFLRGVKRGFSSLHDVQIMKREGGTAWVDISGRLIEYSNRRLYHVVMRDITERKKEEEKLTMTNERLARSAMIMIEKDTRLASIREEINALMRHINMSEILIPLFKLIVDRSGIKQMALFENSGEILRCIWFQGFDDKRLPMDITIEKDDPVNYTIRNLKIIRKGDFKKDSLMDRYFENWIAFPLRGKDRVIGTLVGSPIMPDSKEEVLQPLVDIAALVLEKEGMIKRMTV